MDEWVPEERMNMAKLEPPRKEVKTPKKEIGKLGIGAGGGSRPVTPEKEITVSCSY